VSAIAATAQTLLDLVASEHSRQRDELLREAVQRATEVERHAHLQARAQMRAAFDDARQAADDHGRLSEARLATARRMQQQRAESALVEQVWAALPGLLEQRWQRPDSRAKWIERMLTLGLRMLPRSAWSVAHPHDLPPSDIDMMRARLALALEQEPLFSPEAAIRVGLRVRAGHNVLDGTLEGLLSDRAALGARALALARRAAGE
jgi:hypothetical protein